MSYFVDETELYHHGILGQKWGVRRYQKKDGSLTRLGKKHWEMLDDDTVNRERNKAINTGDLKTIKKYRDRFSADEIDRAIRQKNANEKLKYEMSRKGKKEKKQAEEEAKAMAEAKKNAEKLSNMANKIGSISTALTKGSDAYNSFAKISNSLLGTKFKFIKEKQDPKPIKWTMDKIMNFQVDEKTSEELKEWASVAENTKKGFDFKDKYGKYKESDNKQNKSGDTNKQNKSEDTNKESKSDDKNKPVFAEPSPFPKSEKGNSESKAEKKTSENRKDSSADSNNKNTSSEEKNKNISELSESKIVSNGQSSLSSLLSSSTFSGSSIKSVSSSQGYKTGVDWIRSNHSDYDQNRDYYDSMYYYDHDDEKPWLKHGGTWKKSL